jgi:hypothetical protein
MTRVNVVPVCELSDQHLIAEYHELPRTLKQNINTHDAPDGYVLGTGHMKWACRHWEYTYKRFIDLCNEMKYRGFSVNYDPNTLKLYLIKFLDTDGKYCVSNSDLALNRERIREKYHTRPEFYRWTGRDKPKWLN